MRNSDLNAADNDGKTALIWSVLKDRMDILQLLIDNHVDLNARDNQGLTARDWAELTAEKYKYRYMVRGHRNIRKAMSELILSAIISEYSRLRAKCF